MEQKEINSQSMLRVGTILRGIYRIDSYLSSGGFGNTYVATNIEFDERVAIKEFFMKGVTLRDSDQTIVSVSNSENVDCFQQQKNKFKKEAHRLRKLNNEHIVKVYDLFEENGTAYYVMDYVDGEDLAERLKRTNSPLSEQEVNQILPQILDGLKAIHDEGFCHLDIKPSNIMVDKNGSVKLIDFGASKQIGNNGLTTTSGPTAFAQTPGYAPREQMEQNYEKIGPWTDIYALGATLYALLSNKRPPLPSDIDDDMSADKHLALPLPDSVSNEMKALVLMMVQPNRMQRPQNVSSLMDAEKARIEKGKKSNKGGWVWLFVLLFLGAIGYGGYVSTKGNYKENVKTTATQKRNSSARTDTKQSQWTDSEGHAYVDLGLPSGTLWATCNIGASSPEGYGDYFAWGETKAKTTYNWNNYKWCNGSHDKLTKYCNDSNYGLIDNKSWLEPADDAAYVNWGPAWRIPSQEQFEELLSNTNKAWTTLNGVHGWKFTSKTNSSIFVFLPAAGWRYDSSLNNAGSSGCYWSRTLYTSSPYNARGLYFSSGYIRTNDYDRYYGQRVRPVRLQE